MTDHTPNPNNTPSWGQQPPQAAPGWVTPPLAPRPPKKHRGLKIAGGVVGAIVVISVIASATGGGKKDNNTPAAAAPVATSTTKAAAPTTKAPAAPAPKAKPKPKPAPDTVTYIVTGSRAEVTYGPAGSSLSGHSPMTVKRTLGHPTFYSVTAQLSGSGKVTCKIEIKGKVISQATATGSYNIAMCEVMQDPMGDGWIDANSY